MASVGRKRKQGPREALTGDLSRALGVKIRPLDPASLHRVRDNALHHGRFPEWGTEYGRLFMTGVITSSMHEACKMWDATAMAYGAAIEASRLRTNAPADRVAAALPDPFSELGWQLADRDRRIARNFQDAYGVAASYGRAPLHIFREAVERDIAVTLPQEQRVFCKIAHDLAVYYRCPGLDGARKPVFHAGNS